MAMTTFRRVLVTAMLGGALAAGASCSDSKEAGDAGAGGAGAGAAGQSGASGSSGSGSGGSAGAVGTSGAGGAAMVACAGAAVDNANAGAIANPADFSVNTDTGLPDQHTLWMGRADMVRRVATYSTQGTADHWHVVAFTDEQLNALLAGGSVTVT